MTTDDMIIQRLPLPLSQLLRRAANAKAAPDRLLTSYYAWEAALKLLSSVAIVEYVALERHDADIDDLLKNLARPTIGRWWEFSRRLIPVLADSGDAGFAESRKLVLGRTRDDLPFAAGLDGALREALGQDGSNRTTVRLTELFHRLVDWRNRELGHGAACQKSEPHYDKLGRAMYSGVRDLLGKIDVLAGRRLLYVTDVRARSSGDWVVDCLDLCGETPKRVKPVIVPRSEQHFSVRPNRLYAATTTPGDGGQDSSALVIRPLHPLLLFDNDEEECLFINARRGQQKAEYLCYTTGHCVDKEKLEADHRELLASILGIDVETQDLSTWEVPDEDEESLTDGQESPNHMLGEFELLSKIGQGGMGIVYRAWQPSLGRQVAVKSLIRSGEADAEDRFAREIRVLGQVEHPHVVKIYTSGVDGDNWYFAMELVEGAPLSEIQRLLSDQSAAEIRTPQWRQAISTACEHARARERSLSSNSQSGAKSTSAAERPVPDSSQDTDWATPNVSAPIEHVVAVMRQAAEATQALHAHGVIHRDIKPGNIMITSDGERAVLMDLGLAQLADESEGQLTRTSQFVGTLRYASPEQIVCSRDLDAQTDVYSLGATLWELLTLRPMYGATDETSPHELMVAIQQKPPERIRAFNPSVPSDLEAIVFKCLEKDRHRRYATAGELADDLGRWQQGDTVHARRLTPWYFLERKVARNRKNLALAASGVVAIAAAFWLALIFLLPKSDDTEYRQKCATTVQTLPGLNGGWWFNESPWLIPPVRDAIAREILESKQPTGDIPEFAGNGDKERVGDALRTSWAAALNHQAKDVRDSLEPLVTQLEKLAQADLTPNDRQAILDDVLAKMADDDTPRGEHTRALLYHQLALLNRSDNEVFEKNLKQAKDHYKRAEDNYKKDAPLRYLCLSDHVHLLRTQLFNKDGSLKEEVWTQLNACSKEVNAWRGPDVFQVYADVSYATALRQARKFERADKLFETTLETTRELKDEHPLVASAHEEYAWSLMDQWRVGDAVGHFETAGKIRHALATAGDEAAWQRYFHDLHGLAMAKRYCGQRSEAQQGYEQLVGKDGKSGDVGGKKGEIERMSSVHGVGIGYLTRSLDTRLQNSCERYADCALYAWSPFLAADPKFIQELDDAATLYQKSRDYADTGSITRATMGCKLALTLLLLDRRIEADALLNELEREAAGMDTTSESYARFANLREAAEVLNMPTLNQQEALRAFLAKMEAERDKPANDNRDIFELRLLCAKRLLASRSNAPEEVHSTSDALSYIATVLQDISDKRDKADDGKYREFLRDYWDLAIATLDATDPDRTSQRLVRHDGEHWRWTDAKENGAILAVNLPTTANTDGLGILLESDGTSPHPNVVFFPLSFGRKEVELASQIDLRLRVPNRLQRHVRRHNLLASGLTLWPSSLRDQKLLPPVADFRDFRAMAFARVFEEHTDENGPSAPGDAP